MFKHLNTTLIVLGAFLGLTGCIHKDYPPCEPLTVNLVVADKNYSNISEIDEEDPIDENLPFSAYIPTVCYILRDAETGQTVKSSDVVETTNSDLNHTITFPEELPHGRYELIVWGGIKSLAALDFDNDPSTAAFHTTDAADEDIYLAHTTVEYGPFDTTIDLQMHRTMGKLLIIKELVGRAEGVNRTRKVISDLSHQVDLEANYNGTNDVVFNNTFSPAPKVITKTIVAPSVADGKTNMHIEFYNPDPNSHFPVLIPDDVRINIRPNCITVLRYIYNPEIETFDIYVKNNNSWDKVHQLGIED